MGQRWDVLGVGAGTVRMGRWVREEIGGEGVLGVGVGEEEEVGERGGVGWFWGCCCCRWLWDCEGEGAERETVFVGIVVWFLEALVSPEAEGLSFFLVVKGIPETIGGGRSKPSAAFLDSCLAKSLACHHSRNLSAKIEVGSKSRRLPSRRG